MKTRQKWHLSWKLFVENFTNVTVNIFARISLKTNMTRCEVKKKCLISVFITGMGINVNVCPFSIFFAFSISNRIGNQIIKLTYFLLFLVRLKDTSWQNMNTIYRKHQHFSVIFSSPVRSTEELMSSSVRRCRRPMLTFAFRSNVEKLLGPG